MRRDRPSGLTCMDCLRSGVETKWAGAANSSSFRRWFEAVPAQAQSVALARAAADSGGQIDRNESKAGLAGSGALKAHDVLMAL